MKRGVDIFEKGIKWILGRDSNLKFWLDCWSNEGSLRNLIKVPLRQGEEDLKFKDVISMNWWDWSKLPIHLPDDLMLKIRATPTLIAARGEDRLA